MRRDKRIKRNKVERRRAVDKHDVIVFSGAIEYLTETQRLQLLPGGKLFAIIGKDPVMQGQLHRLNHEGQWEMDVIFETYTPPFINKSKPNDFVF